MSDRSGTGKIVVYITASGEDEAARIARELVDAKLAACVNIIRNVRSIYTWQGRTEDDTEVLMIAKTREELFGELSRKVHELHSYDVPEVIALPVIKGADNYLKWLDESTE